jgi:hypothetical protein
LVHVVHPPGEPARIVPLQAGLLQEFMAASADWVRLSQSEDGIKEEPVHPPAWSIKATAQRGNYAHVRPLVGVVDFPVIREDGSIAAGYGYDPATRLFCAGRVDLAVPEHPTQADAAKALETLYDVVGDFPFADDTHRAAWLAALLTPICRPAFDGLSPGFLIEANARGTGKGMLANVIGAILTGRTMEATTYGDEDENRKKLTATVRQGRRILLYDNLTGRFGGGVIDAFLTARYWEDRILGLSQTGCWTNNLTMLATGNNVSVAEDTCRRLCFIRLETQHEKPEDREDFKRPRLLAYIREHRPALLAAALTIPRAYMVAGRPPQSMRAWGSFEDWSAIVRGAIIFAGGADAGETRVELQRKAGSATEAAAIFARALADMCEDGRASLTCKEIIATLQNPEQRFDGMEGKDVLAALEACMPDVTGRALGNWLKQFDRRRIGGYMIRRSDQRLKGGFRWTAEQVERRDSSTPGASNASGVALSAQPQSWEF